jgi:hypothetical protein
MCIIKIWKRFLVIKKNFLVILDWINCFAHVRALTRQSMAKASRYGAKVPDTEHTDFIDLKNRTKNRNPKGSESLYTNLKEKPHSEMSAYERSQNRLSEMR